MLCLSDYVVKVKNVELGNSLLNVGNRIELVQCLCNSQLSSTGTQVCEYFNGEGSYCYDIDALYYVH